MTANLPAVAEHRQEIAEAQARGDRAAANQAYSLELQALAEAAAEPGGRAVAEAPAALPPERCRAVLDALAAIEPDAAASLRRAWPGAEMAQNLAYVGWTLDRYASGHDTDSTTGLLALAFAMAPRIYFEVNPDATAGPAPLPRETVDAFLAEYEDAEAEVIRRWQGSALASNLAWLAWLLQTYGPGIALDSETGLLRLGAAIGRGVFHHLQAAKKDTAMDTDDQTDYEDELEEVRDAIKAAQSKGDTRRASRLYKQEMEMIAGHDGDGPIVGTSERRV